MTLLAAGGFAAPSSEPVVNGQRPITAEPAVRLGMYFGMEAPFWLKLQSEYDIRVADREFRARLSPRIRIFQPAAATCGSRTSTTSRIARGG